MSQYATFRLDERLFGQDISLVREIIRCDRITPVPRSRSHIRGLINLRGQVVTILDLAVRLGMPRREVRESSHIVILKTTSELASLHSGARTSQDMVGLLVDAIGDVVEADDALVEPPSANVSEAEGRLLSGVLKSDAGLLVLLDLQAILSLD